MSGPEETSEAGSQIEYSSEHPNYVRQDFTAVEQWVHDSTACPEQVEELVQIIQQLSKDNRPFDRVVKKYAQDMARIRANLAKIECESCNTIAALAERYKQSSDALENAERLHAKQTERMRSGYAEENAKLKEEIRALKEELRNRHS